MPKSKAQAILFTRRKLLMCAGVPFLSGAIFFPSFARAQSTTYTYDELGRLKTVAYPGGTVVTYEYDASGNRTSVVTSASFTPITHTYTTPGSFSETVPSGASLVTITVDGAGAGGSKSSGIGVFDGSGGGGGSRAILLNRAVLSAEWNTTLPYVVGAGGSGGTTSNAPGANGGASTVSGTLNGTAISIVAGGGFNNQNGGTASGGTTNTAGGAGVGGSSVSGAGGTGAGGGAGGAGGSVRGGGGGGSYQAGGNGTTNGGAGAAGRIVFAWT